MIDRTVAGLFDKLAQLLNVKHVRFTFIDPGTFFFLKKNFIFGFIYLFLKKGKFGIHLIGSDGIEMHTNLSLIHI